MGRARATKRHADAPAGAGYKHLMIQIFRIVALVEGVTTLALFLVAMPMKYIFGMPFLTSPVGAIHGIAFLAYIGAMWVCLRDYAFSAKDWARTTIAAFFPFGTFLNDPFLKRKQAEAEAR